MSDLEKIIADGEWLGKREEQEIDCAAEPKLTHRAVIKHSLCSPV
jgi:hypothetical protein